MRKTKTKLEKGEVRCKKCKGTGKISAEDDPTKFIWLTGEKSTCPKCKGKGKLDWIENITK